MTAYKEFAHFITLNMANLAETYAQLLTKRDVGYESLPLETRVASARKLLKAVVESYDTQTSAPLTRFFSEHTNEDSSRWAADFVPPQPLFEVECLGQTLIPVVTNLEAGKFLWQMLSDVRATVAETVADTRPTSLPSKADVQAQVVSEDTGKPGQITETLQSLERRARQVQTGTEVAQEIATAPALDTLFRSVVSLIQEQFGYYHVHVYTLENENLIMQAGTGQAGRKMKEAGHKIELSAQKSLVARAARSGEPVLVSDVSQESTWLPNPLLPGTKSELSVPIKLKNEVLGVLDVQHNTVGGLNQEDQILLMGLCGQIAVAINNHQIEAKRQKTQTVLHQSEQKYSELVNNLPVGVYRSLADTDGHFLEANPALVEMFEADSMEEFLKQKASNLYQNPEDREEFRRQMFEHGFLKEKELKLKTLKGRNIWGAVTAAIKEGDDGQVYFEGIIEDITDRKWVEQALRESEQKYRTILENIEDGYYEIDLAGNLTFFNDSLCKVLGYPADELMGMNNREYTDEKNAKILYETFNHVYKTGQPIKDVEWEVIKKDGSKAFVETSASLIRNSEGQPIGFRGIARDIIDRKQAEEELKQSGDFLNNIINAVDDPVFVKDEKHRWVILNDAICEVMGKPREELIGKTDYDLSPKEEADVFWEKDQLVLETGQTNINEEKVTWQGKAHFISTKKSLFKDPVSGHKYIVGSIRDITERKQAEDSLAKVLAETQALYDTSQAVTTATTTDEMLAGMLEALNNNGIAVGASSISFSLLETDELGQPEWGEEVAWWFRDSGEPPLPSGTRFHLREMRTANIWLKDPSNPLLISDGRTDEREDEAFVEKTGILARAILPLSVAGRWVGVLSINWNDPHEFTERDHRLYRVLMGQLASVIETQRLFEQTQQRAVETEGLARQEQTIREITEKLRRAPTLEALTKIAGEELSKVLGVSHSVVKVGVVPQGQSASPETLPESKNGHD